MRAQFTLNVFDVILEFFHVKYFKRLATTFEVDDRVHLGGMVEVMRHKNDRF